MISTMFDKNPLLDTYPLFGVLCNIIDRKFDKHVSMMEAGESLHFTLLDANLFLLDRWKEMEYIDLSSVISIGTQDQNVVTVRLTETFITTAKFMDL